jgi:hypothetical protein
VLPAAAVPADVAAVKVQQQGVHAGARVAPNNCIIASLDVSSPVGVTLPQEIRRQVTTCP